MSQRDIIRNEWTTFTVNDWCSCHRKTLLDSGLAIDETENQPDGKKAEISIGVEERRRVVNFDKMDHPFSNFNNKGGS